MALKHFAKFSLPIFFEATMHTVLTLVLLQDEGLKYEMEIVLCSGITSYFL